MDSLVANYASSDDEEEEERNQEHQVEGEFKKPSVASESSTGKSLLLPPPKPSSSSSLFYSLPPPKDSSSYSSSFVSSLPSPKSLPSSSSESKSVGFGDQGGEKAENGGIFSDDILSSGPFKATSSIFSALPPPKSSSTPFFSSLPTPKFNLTDPVKILNVSSTGQNPKKIVQFKPSFDPSVLKGEDSDEDDEDEKKRKKSISLSSAAPKSLSSILPAPRNTSLGSALSAVSTTSRRSVVEANVATGNNESLVSEQESGGFGNHEGYDGNFISPKTETGAEGAANLGFPGSSGASGWDSAAMQGVTYSEYPSGSDASNWYSSYGVAAEYGSYAVAADYVSYEGNWSNGSVTVPPLEAPDVGKIKGKRGRSEIPIDIVEVKQDELMKNRPREDQAKLTGIAFGPSHKPVSSVKEKPTKLHKRKHQIGSLFFDMKQKEMELAERRSRGLLTKSQTQGKYGW